MKFAEFMYLEKTNYTVHTKNIIPQLKLASQTINIITAAVLVSYLEVLVSLLRKSYTYRFNTGTHKLVVLKLHLSSHTLLLVYQCM